jgi:hypothetical protein
LWLADRVSQALVQLLDLVDGPKADTAADARARNAQPLDRHSIFPPIMSRAINSRLLHQECVS